MAASSADDLKLLGFWASPYVIRVKVALNLKGIEFENLEEDRFGTKSELLLKSNPVYKKIPVLLHAGKPICESMIIVQYIDEVWAAAGPSILPSDPYDRAIARFWAVYIDDKLFPSVFGIIRGKTEEARAEATENASAGLRLLEEALEKCSNGERFFGGDTIGYLDLALGSFLGWVGAAEELGGVKLLDEAKTPRLVRWAEQFRSDDVVKEVLQGTDKFVDVVKESFLPRWNAEA